MFYFSVGSIWKYWIAIKEDTHRPLKDRAIMLYRKMQVFFKTRSFYSFTNRNKQKIHKSFLRQLLTKQSSMWRSAMFFVVCFQFELIEIFARVFFY